MMTSLAHGVFLDFAFQTENPSALLASVDRKLKAPRKARAGSTDSGQGLSHNDRS